MRIFVHCSSLSSKKCLCFCFVSKSKKIVGSSKIGKMNNLKNPDESDVVFLHGQFLLCIFSAKNLPDMDSWIAKLYDKNDVTDPFVDVWLGNARYGNISCGV